MEKEIKEGFNRVLRKSGGYFDLQEFTTVLRESEEYNSNADLKAQMNEQIGLWWYNIQASIGLVELHSKRYINVPKIHIRYIHNTRLGAVVNKDPIGSDYFIGMHFCNVDILRSLFYKLLSSPQVLTWIGDVSIEKPIAVGSPYEFDMHMISDFIHNNPGVIIRPQSPERALAADVLTSLAMNFLTMHEFAHIVRGHVAYNHFIYNNINHSMIDTANENPIDTANLGLRSQAMEIDADYIATFHGFALANQLEIIEQVTKDSFRAIELWLFATLALFRMMGTIGYNREYIGKYSHPPVGIRSYFLSETVGELLDIMSPKLLGKQLSKEEISKFISDTILDIGRGFIDSSDDMDTFKQGAYPMASAVLETKHQYLLREYLDDTLPSLIAPFKLAFTNP